MIIQREKVSMRQYQFLFCCSISRCCKHPLNASIFWRNPKRTEFCCCCFCCCFILHLHGGSSSNNRIMWSYVHVLSEENLFFWWHLHYFAVSTDLILGHTNYLFLQLTWSKNTLISLCVVEYHGNLYKLYEPTGIRCDSKLNSLKFVFLKFYLRFIFMHNIGTWFFFYCNLWIILTIMIIIIMLLMIQSPPLNINNDLALFL